MKTEKEKMLAGELYNARDEELTRERKHARIVCKKLNDSSEDQVAERKEWLKELIPDSGENLWIEPPFFCDYGSNISLGDDVFFNFNCVLLDVTKIRIGSRTMMGPNVQIYSATHPLDHQVRSSGLENGKPVNIGQDVWIGGGTVICPGVSIGDRTVIGAGSVVVKDIPSDVLAVGNPCKVVRKLKEEG